MEVTSSTISPFSDRLMMALVVTVNSAGISYLGHALSVNMRKDLSAHYLRFLSEDMLYAEDGMNMMIERKWMEKSPHAVSRKELVKRKVNVI